MHALIEDGTVKQYPYNLAQLKQANPNCSFPKNPGDDLLAAFGMQRVFFSTPPAVSSEQVLEEQTPVFDTEAQRWSQVWSVRDMTEEEIAARNAAQEASVRSERNDKLAECDWTQVIDAPVDQDAWAAYRQELRDIPSQVGFPWDVIWPTEPGV
jgi:hypothetical protein